MAEPLNYDEVNMFHRRILMLLFPTALLAFAPLASADTFEYHVTGSGSLNVTFDLSSFEGLINDITPQSGDNLSGTWEGSAVTNFDLSGNSSDCVTGPAASYGGPCFAVSVNNGLSWGVGSISPSFNGVGTFTASSGDISTTVTITDVSTTTPEPSAIVLLASILVVVAVIARKRRASRHIAQTAV
jgi:hypothetical protein